MIGAPARIWIGSTTAAGGYGGWGYVIVQGGQALGTAGGDRRTTGVRMALTAMIDALSPGPDAPADGPATLYVADREILDGIAALAGWRAGGWKTEAGEALPDRDLWEKLALTLAARKGPVRFESARGALKDAIAFVDGWAAVALDIARGKGAFSSAIPKPNLRTLVAKLG